jgi:FtsZ-binding cell division protein ZapB
MKMKSAISDQMSGVRNQESGVRYQRSVLTDVRPLTSVLCLLTAVLCSLNSGAVAAEAGNSVDGVRSALEKWVETRKVISLEQRDWKLGSEMLSERIDLVQREIDSLRGKISEAQESISAADQKRADLLAENDKLKEASAGLAESMVALEIRTRTLLAKLPDPIRERVKPLSQRLPENTGDTKLSFSERLQNVVGILNEVNKFNREVTMTSEVRTLPDGSSAEVTALYTGIGQAYYVSADGKHAGSGTASSEGWAWTPDNGIAPQVAETIAILKNEQVASFVQLPVEIR